MPIIYADDFNRANGPVGGSWTYTPANWSIHVNRLYNGNSGLSWVLHSGCAGIPDLYAEVQTVPDTGGGTERGIVLRSDSDGSNCYLFLYNPSSNNPASVGRIYKRVSSVLTKIGEIGGLPTYPGTHSIKGVAVGTNLQLWVDNTKWLDITDASIASGDYAGIAGSAPSTWFDNYDAIGALIPALSVVPNSVLADSTGNILTLTCNVGNWTPGTPGAPAFTVDDGTITAQTVDDVGTATLTYDAPLASGTTYIRDPLNALSVALDIADDPSNCCLEVLRRVGAWPAPDDIYTRLLALARASYPDAPSTPNTTLLDYINGADFTLSLGAIYLNMFAGTKTRSTEVDWLYNLLFAILGITGKALNGVIDVGTNVNVMTNNGAHSLYSVQQNIKGAGDYDLTNIAALINYISDTGTINLQTVIDDVNNVHNDLNTDYLDIIDHIHNLPPLDVAVITAYLDWLTDTKTYKLADLVTTPAYGLHPIKDELEQVHTEVSYISSGGLRNIQQVLDLLQNVHDDAVTQYNALVTLLTAIDSLMQTQYNNLHTDLADVHTDVADLHADVVAVKGVVDDIHADLAALASQLPRYNAPVWPGLANVTLGAGVPLADGFTVPGPLDGVLIDITSIPPDTGRYTFDGVSSWTHLGAIAFVSDRGDFEFPQSFGFQNAILAPQGMRRAASAKGRVKHTTTGTVYPWTINP